MKYKKNNKKQEKYEALLNQLMPEECHDKDCFFKELILTLHPMPRLLVQFKCISKFQKKLTKEQGAKIDALEAANEWVDRGCAEKFAKYYDEDKTFTEIYKKSTSV